jgi:hypothetical protein
VERRQEVSTVEGRRLSRIGGEALLQLPCIAPHRVGIDAHRLPALPDHDGRRELAAKHVEGLTERIPGTAFVRLRPEEGEKLIAPSGMPVGPGGQIDEEGEALRLGKEGGDPAAGPVDEIDGPQGDQAIGRPRTIHGILPLDPRTGP